MKRIYKDIVIGFILASFVFAPTAFAKPSRTRVKRSVASKSKKPLYTNLDRAIKKNKRGMKLSQFANAAEPMVKKREFRDLKKSLLPFWDKKFDKLVVGNDYFVVGFKGQKAFGRFVDRGPIAFIINGKPLLWKDIMIYGRMKKRVLEILGFKNEKKRKVSWQEFLLKQIFPTAAAVTEAMCKDENKGTDLPFIPNPDTPGYGDCVCPPGKQYRRGQGCQPTDDANACATNNPGAIFINKRCMCRADDGTMTPANGKCDEDDAIVVDPGDDDPTPEPKPKKDNKKIGLIIFAAVALLILFMMLKKKKKKTPPVTPEPPVDPPVDPPVPGWTPEPEGQCPTPGARGMTEADLPPECRKSTCNDSNACRAPSSSGEPIF